MGLLKFTVMFAQSPENLLDFRSEDLGHTPVSEMLIQRVENMEKVVHKALRARQQVSLDKRGKNFAN
eukprot:Nk52_evm25s162 gene=Nk52_evmTU25s162